MTTLRKRAIELLHDRPEELSTMDSTDLKTLIHELRVHQIELEVQNEELRAARHDLEKSREEYKHLYEYAPVGYLSLNREGIITRLNLNAARILGESRQRLTGYPLANYIAIHDRQPFREKLLRAWNEDASHFLLELELKANPGISHVQLEFDRDYTLQTGSELLAITITDVSRRLITEEQLRLSHQQLKSALHASHCGLWDWPDMDRDTAWWSPELYHLLGYEENTLTPAHSTFISLLHPSDRERVKQILEHRLQPPVPYEADFRLKCRDGGYRWFHASGQRIHNAEGTKRVTGLIQDITDRRMIADELEQTRARAELANIEKSQFLAAASHDLRQPLQSLVLYLSALQFMDRTEEVSQIYDKMQTSIQTMGKLLRSLLDISRLEAGIVSPEISSFPVMDIFNSILDINLPIARARGLDLRVHACDCVITSDRTMLEEAIQNLVANALDNTDQGGVLIGCRRVGNHARLQVWDSGTGIEPDVLSTLMGMTTAETGSGESTKLLNVRVGLGLSIVKHVVRLLELGLKARSSPGRGSMFSVEVPRAVTGDNPPDKTTVQHRRRPASSAQRSILLIDNNTSILEAFRDATTSLNQHIECAANRQEALDLLQRGLSPDIIISDFRLDDISGIMLIPELRRVMGLAVPAIILTGDTATFGQGEQLPERCKILYKPVNFDDINEAIEDMLASC